MPYMAINLGGVTLGVGIIVLFAMRWVMREKKRLGALVPFVLSLLYGMLAALVALGQALVEAGEADEAREVLGRVPETETRHTRRVAVLLARTHHRTRPERARGLYLRAVRGPGDADAHAEVLEVRTGRVAMVRDFLAAVTPDELAAPRRNPHDPAYQETTLSCLHTILEEEWEHHRYAVRDLDAIEATRA